MCKSWRTRTLVTPIPPCHIVFRNRVHQNCHLTWSLWSPLNGSTKGTLRVCPLPTQRMKMSSCSDHGRTYWVYCWVVWTWNYLYSRVTGITTDCRPLHPSSSCLHDPDSHHYTVTLSRTLTLDPQPCTHPPWHESRYGSIILHNNESSLLVPHHNLHPSHSPDFSLTVRTLSKIVKIFEVVQ